MNTSPHWCTPSLSVHDSRGLVIRQVAYLRTVADESVTPLITRQQHNAAGQRVQQRDPRLALANISSVLNLAAEPLKVDSVDAGWRLSLPGPGGEPLQQWDERGSHWQSTYDDQLRLVAVAHNTQPDIETCVYADASADTGFNLRGQLIQRKDSSGHLIFDSYSTLGTSLRETRTYFDGKVFTSSRLHSPDGSVLEQTDGGGHCQLFNYDIAGQINHVQLQIKGQTRWQAVLQDAKYDAAGHIIEQLAGNGVTRRWFYDPASLRLLRQSARVNALPPLQDFGYEYDRVGNITRILDHVFTPHYFANQRVDGQREFKYDSLNRLRSASGYDDAAPQDNPGRPHPTDPKDRRNYIQTYSYDSGDNLYRIRHVRDGHNHTREMSIDPGSNRGVRRACGDPAPDFGTLFDRHGNLLALQPGNPLQWDSFDQLECVTLVHRDSAPDDTEFYRYSQGSRVYKRHATYSASNSHYHDVYYLPGLEVRCKDNGEELNVITLNIGVGTVRCLHWVARAPAGVDPDQLRFTLDDHLGSCLMELDHLAQLISNEGFYSFGETAWMAARSVIELAYKFVRYSGKEMDESGLYYYGARYYAPWLQRWISSDPAGVVDGPNLYGFTGNNPIRFIDNDGQGRSLFHETPQERDARKAQSAAAQQALSANKALSHAVVRHMKILEVTDLRIRAVESQLDNLQSQNALTGNAVKRTGTFVVKQVTSYVVGIGVGAVAGALGAVAGPVGTAFAIVLGMLAKTTTGLAFDYVAEQQGLSTSVILKSRKLNPESIVRKGEYKTVSLSGYAHMKYKKTFEGVMAPTELNALKATKEVSSPLISIAMKAHESPLSGEIGAVMSTLFGAVEIMYEIERAKDGMTPALQEKIELLNQYIPALIDVLERGLAEVSTAFDTANRDSIHTYRMLSKFFGNAPGDTYQSVADATNATISNLRNLHARTQRGFN